MANVKITDLTADTTPVDGTAIEVASLSGSTYTSKKMLLSTLATYIVGKVNALLDTTPLTILRGGTGANSAQAAAASLGVPWTVAKSGAPVSATGTTTETTLATITIPAGAIGPNGFVEIVPLFSFTGSTNAKTMRVRLGGTEVYNLAITAAATIGYRPLLMVGNTNSASSQVAFGTPNGVVTTASPIVRTSINTASATSLTVTGQLTTATETVTLENYFVRITYGA